MKGKNNAGVALMEVLIAVAIMSIIVVPICSGMLLSMRMNGKAEAILRARLAVSSTVNVMMATGIDPEFNYDELGEANGVEIQIGEAVAEAYHEVTVTDEDNLVTVTTKIRVIAGGSE